MTDQPNMTAIERALEKWRPRIESFKSLRDNHNTSTLQDAMAIELFDALDSLVEEAKAHEQEPLRGVLVMQRANANTWKDRGPFDWLEGLQEEVDELQSTLSGQHDGPVEHELRQIASIALNWLVRRDTLVSPYERPVQAHQEASDG